MACFGKYPGENGCEYELDSPYMTGDCEECKNFGCKNDFNCEGCNETECPNMEEMNPYPKTIADKCNDCGGDIYVGEEYYDFSGTNICMDCIDTYLKKYRKTAKKSESENLTAQEQEKLDELNKLGLKRNYVDEWKIWKSKGFTKTLLEYLKDPSWLPPEFYHEKVTDT